MFFLCISVIYLILLFLKDGKMGDYISQVHRQQNPNKSFGCRKPKAKKVENIFFKENKNCMESSLWMSQTDFCFMKTL